MSKLILAAALLATATPAFAQSADPSSWTGFYVGGRAGYSFQPGDGDETVLFDNNLDGNFGDTVRTTTGANAFSPGFCGGGARSAVAANGCTKDNDNLEFALHAGYDFDLGGFVVGGLAEIGMGYAEDSVTAFSTTPANYTWTRRMAENYGLRARAGYAFGAERNTLVYGTGGVVWAKMDNSFRSSNRANAYQDLSDDKVMGWRAGGGVEQRVHKNLSIGLQFLHTSLKDDGARLRVSRGAQPVTNPFILVNANGTDFARSHSRFVTNNVSATANFRF
ncbi:outer membrane beta-barrel protein [Sphingomonas sp. BIUV-7]|uniref:Outer membrane beta-barrel protein n=1 Tax=Sphingomonas natans TaxID=3063330 RepID=A0ABT8YDN5_9SPHN|nr:outer membrane beta-barrel protein [Sphingomonas sp. BIUV-7]MDO6415710.1 outer membrane beta-barrel protein [Sphingomonas sp. BIUV-7]